MEAITICNTIPEERGVNTDHIPIMTVLDINLTKAPTQIARNFRDVDWAKFHETLEGKLAGLGLPSCITTHSALSCACEKLTHALQETIEDEVPRTEICACSKHWWSKELKILRKEAEKLGRKPYKLRHIPDHPCP